MKKILAVLLALLTLIPLLVACQDTPEKPAVTTVGQTKDPDATGSEDGQTTEEVSGVPQTDYKEREFKIAAPQPWGNTYFDRDEMTNDTVNDAIYTRNSELESFFNITISSVNLGWTSEQAVLFKPYLLSGEDKIDTIGVATYQSGKPFITENLILPWNGVPHIDITKSWWNKSCTDSLAVLGNYYYLSGDLNYRSLELAMGVFFNKDVAEVNKAVVGDPYQTVRDGKWTIDTFNNIVKNMSRDNGDGIWDGQDTYGHLQYYYSLEAWVYGSNYHTVRMTDKGPEFNYYSEKLQNILNQVYNMLYVSRTSYMGAGDGGGVDWATEIFFDNRALFFSASIEFAPAWRDQETDFGILPNPKYNEKQKEYTSYSDQWGLVMALPVTATNLERTGAILEEMCYRSKKTVRVAIYDKTLLGKGIRDDESEEMLDILFKGIIYDTGITFCTDLTTLPVRDLIGNQSNGLSSWWGSKQNPIKKNFQELFDHVKLQLEDSAA